MMGVYCVGICDLHFPKFPKSLFQSEAKCKAIDMKTIFILREKKNRICTKIGFALSLVLEVGAFGTRKWLLRQFKIVAHNSISKVKSK